jgi:hypothetical protein
MSDREEFEGPADASGHFLAVLGISIVIGLVLHLVLWLCGVPFE